MTAESATIDSLLTEEEKVKIMDISEASDQDFNQTVREAFSEGIDALINQASFRDEKRLENVKLPDDIVSEMNEHELLLLKIIKLEEELWARDLYSRYQEEMNWARSRSTLRKYLNRMQDKGLIEKEGSKNTLKFRFVY